MGTFCNVLLASAHGRCTVAALSCIQWKAHHGFHVPHVIIDYLQFTQNFAIYVHNISHSLIIAGWIYREWCPEVSRSQWIP